MVSSASSTSALIDLRRFDSLAPSNKTGSSRSSRPSCGGVIVPSLLDAALADQVHHAPTAFGAVFRSDGKISGGGERESGTKPEASVLDSSPLSQALRAAFDSRADDRFVEQAVQLYHMANVTRWKVRCLYAGMHAVTCTPSHKFMLALFSSRYRIFLFAFFLLRQACAEASTQLRALNSLDRVAKRLVTDLGLARSRLRVAKPQPRESRAGESASATAALPAPSEYTKAALEFHATQSARDMATLSVGAQTPL
jgi:hypothetical protein